jgi:guanylate kinase
MINISKIVVICGFSSAGKDKISKYIADNYNYNFIVSHSSRPMRPNESEGNPYYFVTRSQFEDMMVNDEFIEYRKYNTLVNNIPDVWYYGVHKDSIDLSNNNYVVVLDMLGLMEFKKYYKDNIISFFIDVHESERRRRAYQNRKDFDLTEWNRRYLDDINQFPKELIEREVDYIIENYDFDKCINEIIEKLNGGN